MSHMTATDDPYGIKTEWVELLSFPIWTRINVFVFKYYDAANGLITGYGISVQRDC